MDSPKYNRTFHLPWSKGATNDDKIAPSVDSLLNQPLIITEKMDGSNTSLEASGCFARTHAAPPNHPSFDALKALHASIKYIIPENLQIFGEWCFALHSIPYDALPGYFMTFGIRHLGGQKPWWYDWAQVEQWSAKIGLPTVPVVWKGFVASEETLKNLTEKLSKQPSVCGQVREGLVVRIEGCFNDSDFSKSVMKWVRKNHVQTSDHWKDQEIIKNKLKI